MIKRILLLVTILFSLNLQVKADVLPVSSSDILPSAIGMYQMPQHIVIYDKPDKKSEIVYQANWDYKSFNSSNAGSERIFSVFVQSKELAYSQVTDFTDDWIEVVYDKYKHKKGWIQAEDLRFMQWRSFYNIYGRKYGIKIFEDAPKSTKDIYSSTDENAQLIESIHNPSKIKLTVVKGNWALITAIEDNVGKTGYIRWRGDDGVIYAFPAIK